MCTDFQASAACQEVLQFHFPRYGELPALELYMDQVLGVVNQSLRIFAVDGENLLTPAMVNNYVKKKLLPPALGKRYSPGHVAHLLFICTLKPVLSISEIQALLTLECQQLPAQQAFDWFGDLLEQSLRCVFAHQSDASALPQPSSERLVRAAVFSFANKLYLQKHLAWSAAFSEEKAAKKKAKESKKHPAEA
jgi:DNA-binding transcriptional MerR regulator